MGRLRLRAAVSSVNWRRRGTLYDDMADLMNDEVDEPRGSEIPATVLTVGLGAELPRAELKAIVK